MTKPPTDFHAFVRQLKARIEPTIKPRGNGSEDLYREIEHTHVFIVTPNNSGSTILDQALGNSPNVSTLPHEGHWVAPKLMPFPLDRPDDLLNWTVRCSYYEDPTNYDWPAIKALWRLHWDLSKPILVEKSPPNVCRVAMLQREFPGAYFLLSVRNPYAFCASIKARKPWAEYPEVARHWLRCQELQERNRAILTNYAETTYEEFCREPQHVVKRFADLIPGLGDIDLSGVFEIKGRNGTIADMNAQAIGGLSRADIDQINSVLRPEAHRVLGCGYELM